MPLLSLARPVENATSPAEARVLAVIDHLMPVLADWRQGKDLRREGTELERHKASAQNQFAEVRQAVEQASQQCKATEKSLGPLKGGAIAAFVAGVALAFFLPLWMSLVVVAGGLGLGYRARQVATLAAQQADTQKKAEASLAELDTQIKSLAGRKQAILAELAGPTGVFPK
jgi:hypothetical protein